jgi:hypothetical protein
MAVNMKITVFWGVASNTVVEVVNTEGGSGMLL